MSGADEARKSALRGQRLEDVARTQGEHRRVSTREEARARRAPDLVTTAQAEVAMELLSGNSEFDAFLGQIQTWLNETIADLLAANKTFEDSIAMDFATLAQEKLVVQKLVVRREALLQVLKLPSENAEAGRAAKQKLAEGDDDAA